MTVVSSSWTTVILEACRRDQACLNIVCASVLFIKRITETFYNQTA